MAHARKPGNDDLAAPVRGATLLGIGSALNRKLKANLLQALAELSLDMPVEEVTEIDKLLQYDISGIPALAINGKVLFQQEVPSVSELRQLLINFLDLEPKVIPMKKILVPVDFSDASLNALNVACHLAVRTHARLYVLHVNEMAPYIMSVHRYDFPAAAVAAEHYNKEATERIEATSIGVVNHPRFRQTTTRPGGQSD